MIVSMKKVFLIVQGKDVSAAVDMLRNLGSVHVVHEHVPSGSGIYDLNEQIRTLNHTIDILSVKQPHQESLKKDQWQQKCQEALDSLSKIHELKEEVIKRKMLIQQYEPWGDFDPQSIEALTDKGVYVRLYRIPKKKLNGIPQEIFLQKVSEKAGIAHCVAISSKRFSLPFEVVSFPPMSLNKMRSLQEENNAQVQKIQRNIDELGKYKKSLQKILDEKTLELKYQEAISGMQEEQELALLKGFCPVDQCETLSVVAQKEQWALHTEEPTDDDKIPTLIKNPKWVGIIKPVFSMMNVLPGYKEFDISLFFLLFFSLFFGMLIGDAAYGAIFFGLTALAHLKFSQNVEDKSVFFLMYALSLSAVVWGIFTGTFFGQAWLGQTIQPLLPWLRSNENIQELCFIIGATHLSIAHVWRGVIKAPSIAALAEVGWLSLLWGMFFLAKFLIIGNPIPIFAKSLFVIGPVLIVLFSHPKRNPLKAIGPGLGDLSLNFINTFTDIVSYIRLFAVGLASVAVADAFNQMAADIGVTSFLTGVIVALILVFGHLLNIGLCIMSVLVHGVRLNVLEFSNHLNMEWSGVAYDPLRRTKAIR